MVDDEVDERLAGLLVDLVQHFGGDLDEVGVKLRLVPFTEHVADFGRGHAQAATHEVVAFGDELHVGVFDAVVHHLDEVAGAVETDVGDARLAFGLGSDGFENRLQGLPGFLGAARHHGRAKQRAFLAAGNATADEVQSACADFLLTTDGVREVGVAGIDDDVARFHQVGERVDHGVGRRAGLDHDDGGARLGEAVDEFLEGLRRIELTFRAMFVHELFGAGVGAVEHGHLVAMVREVARKASAHRGKTDDTDIRFS